MWLSFLYAYSMRFAFYFYFSATFHIVLLYLFFPCSCDAYQTSLAHPRLQNLVRIHDGGGEFSSGIQDGGRAFSTGIQDGGWAFSTSDT